jgi:outer membrane protein assembly factor BamB
MRRIVLGSLLASLLVLAPTFAANWPRFRGPNGTGIATDKDIPTHWNDKEGVLWKVAVPGIGNSSPVIWGNRIFLQSSTDDGAARMLLCLDTADGKAIWSQKVGAGKGKIHPKSSWASSTPATDGERVYTMFWDGTKVSLYGYSFDGKPLWQYNLGSFTSQHGAGTSPMAYDGLVYLANDQDGDSVLVAIDGKTGEKVWEAPRKPFRACYSTPFILEKEGNKPELIVASTAGVTSYEPKTGRENWAWAWHFEGMALRTVASPVYTQGLIVAPAGDGSGARNMVAITADGKRLAWQTTQRNNPYVPTLVTSGAYVFGITDNKVSFANCYVAKTGRLLFSERLDSLVSASPVLIDGKVYAIGEDGVGYVFEAAPTFKLLAKNPLGEGVMASPAVADGRLYIRGQTHLFCVGKAALK